MTSIDDAALALEWGLKESFRSYLERLADHDYRLGGGASRVPSGELRFPHRNVDDGEAPGPDLLAFAGRVDIEAHGGLLNVTIADPEIAVREDGTATLSAVVDEEEGEPVRMVVADLVPDRENPAVGPALVRWTASLADDGQFLFMGRYVRGEEMDDVTVVRL